MVKTANKYINSEKDHINPHMNMNSNNTMVMKYEWIWLLGTEGRELSELQLRAINKRS